jgi:Flp pilus assembly pilin Flp
MLKFIKNFRNDEDGAVTVDWVVLTAAIVALGLLVGNQIMIAANNEVADIASDMSTGATVPTGLVTSN